MALNNGYLGLHHPNLTPKPKSEPMPMTECNLALWYRQFGDPIDVLTLESSPLAPRPADLLRVQMHYAPINASDLIPITGAYRHRVAPPQVAGYEGVGTVIAAPPSFQHRVGQRVLPLRGVGCWQHYVDIDPQLAIPVPEDIPSTLAARAYINPLAALLMLQQWPVSGKNVLITAGGSACALLLAQWAQLHGAHQVVVVYRASAHAERLHTLGLTALQDTAQETLKAVSAQTDIVFDAVGGDVGQLIWQALPEHAHFVAYGVLSGTPVKVNANRPALHWFHVRHTLGDIGAAQWQQLFFALWPLLHNSECGEVEIFPLSEWRAAIESYHQSGRSRKPMLCLDR
ncbi:zinc-dependent alcohol dehydrogenase family protein [Pantoea sp. S61]|uniref:zinc-dependent alcohol dehydrogenase family protein n=1 Tax=Pantoea sp. S61 TaxID=2767442 RepID=UPI00351BFFE2